MIDKQHDTRRKGVGGEQEVEKSCGGLSCVKDDSGTAYGPHLYRHGTQPRVDMEYIQELIWNTSMA